MTHRIVLVRCGCAGRVSTHADEQGPSESRGSARMRPIPVVALDERVTMHKVPAWCVRPGTVSLR